MPNADYSVSFAAGSVSFSKNITRTLDGVIGHEIALPAAAAGTLSTRTDDDTGELTMDDSNHGISTADVIDLYWNGGVRYGITVGTVSDVTVPIGADNSGAGDVLPTANTAITAQTQTDVTVQIDGDNLGILGLLLDTTGSAGKGHADMQNSGGTSIEAITFVGNVPRVYDITGGDTNVFTGDPITSVKASNGDSAAAATLKVAGVQDSTV